MFKAELIVLVEGQSYRNATIFEDCDMDDKAIPTVFEEWTACFESDNKCIIANYINICLIQLSKEQSPAGQDMICADRLVLKGDVVYQNVKIIHHTNWDKLGIPSYFVKSGKLGQMVFSCSEGTFLTHDKNVVSLIMCKTGSDGVVQGLHCHNSAKHLNKQTLKPSTIHGQIGR